MSQVITTTENVENRRVEITPEQLERALAQLTYGWIGDRDVIQESLQDRGANGMILRRLISHLYSQIPAVPIMTDLGDRVLSPTYRFADNSTYGSPLSDRQPLLDRQRERDVDMASFRQALPDLQGGTTGTYSFVGGRRFESALLPNMIGHDVLNFTSRIRNTIPVAVNSPFLKKSGVIHVGTSLAANKYKAGPTGSEDMSIRLKVYMTDAGIKSLGLALARPSGHFQTQLRKVPRIKSVDQIHAAVTSLNGKRNMVMRLSSGIGIDDTVHVTGSIQIKIDHMLPTGEFFKGEYSLLINAVVEGGPAKLNERFLKGGGEEIMMLTSVTKIITIIARNCPETALIATGLPVLPESVYPKDVNWEQVGSIAICDSEGQRTSAEYSRIAARVDPWSMLPHALKTHDSLSSIAEKRQNLPERTFMSITKVGLEMEDAEAFIQHYKTKYISDVLEKTIGYILALLAGVDGTSINDEVRREFYEGTLEYIRENGGIADTHSGIIRTTQPEQLGEYTSPDIVLTRLTLSRLMTAGFETSRGKGVYASFHTWSMQDLQALRIPLCVTLEGIYVYSVDDVFLRMLPTSDAWKSKDQIGLTTTPTVCVGRIASPLIEVTDPNKVSHTVILQDGRIVSCDAIIHDMSVLFLQQENQATLKYVVWHPSFCIILRRVNNRLTATVIAGPRPSRLVRPVKNKTEVLKEVLGIGTKIHEATILSSKGYTNALLKYRQANKM